MRVKYSIIIIIMQGWLQTNIIFIHHRGPNLGIQPPSVERQLCVWTIHTAHMQTDVWMWLISNQKLHHL